MKVKVDRVGKAAYTAMMYRLSGDFKSADLICRLAKDLIDFDVDFTCGADCLLRVQITSPSHPFYFCTFSQNDEVEV